jgi:hypothetical protein
MAEHPRRSPTHTHVDLDSWVGRIMHAREKMRRVLGQKQWHEEMRRDTNPVGGSKHEEGEYFMGLWNQAIEAEQRLSTPASVEPRVQGFFVDVG